MLSLKNKSIAAKITVVIAGFSVLACILIGLATYGLQRNDATVQEVLSKQARALFLAADSQQKASLMHQRAFETLVETDQGRWPELQKAEVDAADDLGKVLAEMKAVLDEDDFKLYDPIVSDVGSYRTAQLRGYDLQRSGKRSEAEAQLQGEVSQIFARLNGTFETLVAKQVHDMDGASSAVHDLSHRTVVTMIVTGLVGLGLTIVGALLLVSTQISRPLKAMTEAMRRLASGDTTVTVPATDRKDEIGAMAEAVQVFKQAAVENVRLEGEAVEARHLTDSERSQNEAVRAQAARQQSMVVQAVAEGLEQLSAGNLVHRLNTPFAPDYEKLRIDFNDAMEKLEATMRVVATNTGAIRMGSGEISTAASDLSRRTEQQAASLEETAAALDEITATVKKSSEGAIHARGVVSGARDNAEHSGEVVRQAQSAMEAIETSSRQVSNIIGVIDEIAFQTNLLALNAGVEAARAGDAGRGFAVVASEVRGLAQRSAEAAKEIKTLISTSSDHVGKGVALVGETGTALERIAAQVTEINTIVIDMAATAQEQASALQQVNTAINQMDQMTQQNAAMVEQSTAASQSLAREADELANLIGRFRVNEAGGTVRQELQRVAPHAFTSADGRSAARPVTALKVTGRTGAALKVATAPQEQSWEEF